MSRQQKTDSPCLGLQASVKTGLAEHHRIATGIAHRFEELARGATGNRDHAAFLPGIADRLQKSSAGFPKPNRSWWQRLFGQ